MFVTFVRFVNSNAKLDVIVQLYSKRLHLYTDIPSTSSPQRMSRTNDPSEAFMTSQQEVKSFLVKHFVAINDKVLSLSE